MTHVDNFTIAGKANFLEMLKKVLSETLKVSKMEKNKFRISGWDIERYEDQIKVSMQDYANSLKEIMEIRKADRYDRLTKLEMKEY